MALDIEERHLLRLGHGEEALETEKDFSRFVNNEDRVLPPILPDNFPHCSFALRRRFM